MAVRKAQPARVFGVVAAGVSADEVMVAARRRSVWSGCWHQLQPVGNTPQVEQVCRL